MVIDLKDLKKRQIETSQTQKEKHFMILLITSMFETHQLDGGKEEEKKRDAKMAGFAEIVPVKNS